MTRSVGIREYVTVVDERPLSITDVDRLRALIGPIAQCANGNVCRRSACSGEAVQRLPALECLPHPAGRACEKRNWLGPHFLRLPPQSL